MKSKQRQRLKLYLLISLIMAFLAFGLIFYAVQYSRQQFAENILETPYAYRSYTFSNLNIEDQPYYGDSKAGVTIVAFTDINSEESKDFAGKIFSALKKDYFDTGIVKFYYKPYITLQDIEERNSNFEASMMLECIKKIKREKYLDIYFGMMLKNISGGGKIIYGYQIPLNSYNECMYSSEALRMLYKSALEIEGLGMVGINQRFYIGIVGKGNIILDGVQQYEEFQQAIRQQEIKIGN